MTSGSTSTIYALSSGAGLAAIAVIRVTGDRAIESIRALAGDVPVPRRATRRVLSIPDGGEAMDEAIVLWLPGPATFTGEDCAEFHVHGSRAVVAKLLDELAKLEGYRAADPGAFTRRAFENGKLDLMAVEGLADLILSETEEQRRQAWFHKAGSASEVFETWRARLVAVLARFEAAIDFSDEEGVETEALAGVFDDLHQVRNDLASALTPDRAGERIRAGVRAVLAGRPNVGKSSILNLLANREAAIVSPIKGTTRDAIEVHMDIAGIPVTFVDTAGLNAQSDDDIELLGMARSMAELDSADLVLWITAPDISGDSTRFEIDSDAIRILNKSDLDISPEQSMEHDVIVSAKTGAGVDEFLEVLEGRISRLFSRMEPHLITRARHREAVSRCVELIDAVLCRPGAPVELSAESLRLAARELERLIGRVDVEDLLDVIFRDFCIGK